jgi:aspartyl-tRNA(Asn)/glutamyl-tRNA(Gln) amidotransferase subunit A
VTLAEQARALAAGETTSRALVDASLAAISADTRPFTDIFAAEARAMADAWDRSGLRADVSPLAGLPVSVKALFDIEGLPTPAGSPILSEGPIATRDAPIVQRLRAAGAVIVGRTHLSAFAFTPIGLNPFGRQPVNPHDPTRVPGGSSSGAAVSVALGQTAAAVGTDTGGSIRIPAAACGVTGFKPTQRRVTREGAVPLAASLDSIGPLGTCVDDCRRMDAVLADTPAPVHAALNVAGLRLGVICDFVLDDLEPQVARDFDRAAAALSAAGARIETVGFPALMCIPALEARGGVINAEAFATHSAHGWLAQPELYDPNVLLRVELGGRMSVGEISDVRDTWAAMAVEAARLSQPFDALIMPACAITAPRIADVANPQAFARAAGLIGRNCRIVNLLDRCAITVPMSQAGDLPTGFMLVGETMGDARLLAAAEAVEAVLNRARAAGG